MAGCLQTLFCSFNGLVAVLAAACVGVGAWAMADKENFVVEINKMLDVLHLDKITGSDIQNVAILIVIIGCVILVIAGIGCLGAMKSNKCLLGTFFISMLIICVAVIVVAVLVKFYPNKLRNAMSQKFKKYIDGDQDAGLKEEIDNFQKTFHCCGINGPSDYTKPPTSCADYKIGCADKFMEKITNVQSGLFITSIVTLILLVLATAISGYLYCRGDGQAV